MSPDVADQDHLTAYRPPGPSVLFAGIYYVLGHNYGGVRIVNCLLARFRSSHLPNWRQVFGRDVGILAAAAIAIFPLAVFQSTDLVSEPLGVLLFLLFLDAALSFAESPNWSRSALAGIVLGLSLLTRANYVLMLPLMLIWIAWCSAIDGTSCAKRLPC